MEPELDDTVITRRAVPADRVSEGAAPDDAASGDTVLRRAPAVLPAGRAAAEPATAPAPATYGLRIGDRGEAIRLTRPVLIGRRPVPPRIPTGSMPLLVTVDSPRQEISGTHLELRELGSTVVVTDLRSTNGTVVTVPGRRARTLRQGESMAVGPGASVDIGDGVVIEILPLRHG